MSDDPIKYLIEKAAQATGDMILRSEVVQRGLSAASTVYVIYLILNEDIPDAQKLSAIREFIHYDPDLWEYCKKEELRRKIENT